MYWWIATCVLGILVFMIWCLNHPIPQNFSQPFLLQYILAINTMYSVYFKILETLGVRSFVVSIRQLLDNIKKSNKPNFEGLDVENTFFDGVRVRIYKPSREAPDNSLPALIYYHGGGWVFCDVEFFDISLAEIARAVNMVIINVDYRLAPEHPFPAPFDDALIAAKYFLKHTSEYGVNPSRVVIGGDSAGGTLAAAVSLKLRNELFPIQPCRMLLIHPALQAIDFHTPSMIQNKKGPYLDRETMAGYWSMYICGSNKYCYAFERNLHTTSEIKEALAKTHLDHSKLGEEFLYSPYSTEEIYDGDREIWTELRDTLMNPYFAPLMADDLRKLPDTYMFTAGADVLRDDCLHFIRRLQEAGVHVTHYHMPHGIHGLNVFTQVFQEGKDLLNDIIRHLKRHV